MSSFRIFYIHNAAAKVEVEVAEVHRQPLKTFYCLSSLMTGAHQRLNSILIIHKRENLLTWMGNTDLDKMRLYIINELDIDHQYYVTPWDSPTTNSTCPHHEFSSLWPTSRWSDGKQLEN